jgi:hypothetical protein
VVGDRLESSVEATKEDSGVRSQKKDFENAPPRATRSRTALPRGTTSPHTETEEKEDYSKLHEQGGNIYENKGSVFHRPLQSENVAENKGGYSLKAGIS